MIQIDDYNPQWPRFFEELSSALKNALGTLALAVEHVGSTAVPNLAAKPIIDIDVVIESENLLPTVIRALNKLGYIHRGNQGVLGREAFKRTTQDTPRDGTNRVWHDHHLYVCAKDSLELRRHLAFRDFLRGNAEYVIAYGDLKRELARQYPDDRPAYTEAKTQFIENIYRQVL